MIIIRPTAVPPNDLTDPDAVLIDSNVAATDAGEGVWASGTTYAEGDIVSVLGETQRRYESLENANTGNDPTDSPTQWLDLGATNRWRMFDGGVDTATTNSDAIEVELGFDQYEIVNGLALFNVLGARILIDRYDEDDNLVYEAELAISIQLNESNWWAYFFGVDNFGNPRRDLVDLELPTTFGGRMVVRVERTGAVGEIGLLVVGRKQSLGTTLYGTTIGIEDFSTKERDTFGNFTIVERRFINKAEYTIFVPTQDVATLKRAIADRRAKPTVYVGADEASATLSGFLHEETIIYGFPRDFQVLLVDARNSECLLEVEGL